MGWASNSLHHLGALALPPRCPGCGTPVERDHRFCAGCWGSLRFLGPPWCSTCNIPLPYDLGAEVRCARCLADPPRHAGIRAAVAYGPIARQLALKLKYGRRIGIAETMARAIARSMPADIDLLIPVPLHRWRLWSRGYNQAALIADRLATRSALPHGRDILIRTRHTPPLRGVNPRVRAQLVKGVFALSDRAPVRGRRIGLVDDVHTSGATADACTRVLLSAGARSVTLLCWARVLPADVED